MKDQATSPAKTGVLLVGAGGSLALAYWSISQAMAPPVHPPTVPPTQGPPAQTSTTQATAAPLRPLVTEVKGEELPAGSSTQNMIGQTPAARAIAQSIGILYAKRQGQAPLPAPSRPITGEAALAPGADPFLPYVQPRNSASPASNTRVMALPTFSRAGAMGMVAAPTNMQVALREPELAGTLLGDRPSAVFRAGKHLTSVAAGETYDGWTVVRVDDGDAVVMHANTRLHLHVGIAHTASSAPSQQANATEQPAGTITAATPAERRADIQPTDTIAASTAPDILPSEPQPPSGSTKSNSDRKRADRPVGFGVPAHVDRAAAAAPQIDPGKEGPHVKYASVEAAHSTAPRLPLYHAIPVNHVTVSHAPLPLTVSHATTIRVAVQMTHPQPPRSHQQPQSLLHHRRYHRHTASHAPMIHAVQTTHAQPPASRHQLKPLSHLSRLSHLSHHRRHRRHRHHAMSHVHASPQHPMRVLHEDRQTATVSVWWWNGDK